VQFIEQVEELLLCFLLAAEELDVVHDQYIDLTERMCEFTQRVVLDRVHEVVGECLRRQI